MSVTRKIFSALAAIVIVGAVGALIWMSSVSLPEGPVPIVWDREACAYCRMHIGEPAFAAQLHGSDGRIHNFDDPGCLFEYIEKRPDYTRAAYFQDHDNLDWLRDDEAAFVPADHPTPMGYGIKAVRAGTEGAMDWAWARERVLSRRDTHAQGHSPGGAP